MSTSPEQNRFAPPVARVDDVPAGAQELAGRGTRFGAALLDGLIQAGVFYALAFTVVPSLMPNPKTGASGSGLVIQFAVFVLILLAVQGYLLATQGQTIGKKLLGIRIVRTSGEKVDAARVLGLRYVLIWAIAMIPVIGWIFSLVDALMIFRDSRKCLHDNIADTVVIKA
ncbi:MAG: RDD family protein [Burkholderiales bacterium]